MEFKIRKISPSFFVCESHEKFDGKDQASIVATIEKKDNGWWQADLFPFWNTTISSGGRNDLFHSVKEYLELRKKLK